MRICISIDGDKYYYVNDRLHRIGRPAIEYANGDYEWYFNDTLHRDDGGPAISHTSREMESWWYHDKNHRLDGPASIHSILGEQYWISDCELPKQTFYKFKRIYRTFLIYKLRQHIHRKKTKQRNTIIKLLDKTIIPNDICHHIAIHVI
jgi:hypothetical protein